MLAVIKHTTDPEITAIKATEVIAVRLSGVVVLSDAIIIQEALILPKSHMAYVAIAELRV